MQRSLSVVKTKTQYFMTLPIDWIRGTNSKPRDLLMVFSPDVYSSPLLVVTQKEYMENPKIRKLIEEITEIMEKNKGVI